MLISKPTVCKYYRLPAPIFELLLNSPISWFEKKSNFLSSVVGDYCWDCIDPVPALKLHRSNNLVVAVFRFFQLLLQKNFTLIFRKGKLNCHSPKAFFSKPLGRSSSFWWSFEISPNLNSCVFREKFSFLKSKLVWLFKTVFRGGEVHLRYSF